MPQDVDYKLFLSISIPADQRQLFYRSLTQIRQHYPFATKSALVVQAVIAAAQQEQQLKELLAHLPPGGTDHPARRTNLHLALCWEPVVCIKLAPGGSGSAQCCPASCTLFF